MNPRISTSSVDHARILALPETSSTQEVARSLGVSLRTVQLWVDGGLLDAWKTAGGHRRIPRDSVVHLISQLHSRESAPGVQEASVSDNLIYLAHHPILDRHGNPIGHELLYRCGPDSVYSSITDPVQATSRVIRTAFGELGFLGAIGDGLCFINVEATMLSENLLELLDPSRIVLELPGDSEVTESLQERCVALKRAGFRLLLENFVPGRSAEELLPLADFIKIDFRSNLDSLLVSGAMESMSGRVKLIGGRLETLQAYDLAKRIGCDYFQGFYFSRPVIVRGREISPEKAALLDLLRLLLYGNAENEEIESRLKQNPGLCFSLIRLANSAASGLSRRVNNIREILLVLGRKKLTRWVQLLLFTGNEQLAGAASPLLLAAAYRGRFLESLMAQLGGQAHLQESAFLVGILSYIDTLLSTPLEQVVSKLGLSDEIEAALLTRSGPLGDLLSLSVALDEEDFATAQTLVERLNIDHDTMLSQMVESLGWSRAILKD